MKKPTKAIVQKYINDASDVINAHNPIVVNDSSYTHYIDTPMGKVFIRIDNEISPVFAIDMRFENVKDARKHYDCNPFNGKLNILEFDPDDAVNILHNMLRYMMNINKHALT